MSTPLLRSGCRLGDHHIATANSAVPRMGRTSIGPNRLRTGAGDAVGFTHRLGDPVDHDREQHDAEPRHQAGAGVVREPDDHLEPRPAPPMSPAMITTESTIMIVWFTPSRIEGRASGSCTFQQQLRSVAPIRHRRLDGLRRAPGGSRGRSAGCPAAARRRARRSRRGRVPTRNSAITGTRYTNCGMVCITSRIGRSARCTRSLRAAPDPERDRDRDRHDDRHHDLAQRVHRVVPHPEHPDRRDAHERRAPRAPTVGTRAMPISAATPATIHHGSVGQQAPAADPARTSRSRS